MGAGKASLQKIAQPISPRAGGVRGLPHQLDLGSRLKHSLCCNARRERRRPAAPRNVRQLCSPAAQPALSHEDAASSCLVVDLASIGGEPARPAAAAGSVAAATGAARAQKPAGRRFGAVLVKAEVAIDETVILLTLSPHHY